MVVDMANSAKYLVDRWYVAAWAHELDKGPLGRTILDEPIVFFRTQENTVAALEDSCAHRFMPLSKGRIINGHIECPYHGLVYDKNGNCTRVPGQSKIPPSAQVRKWPVVEKFRWIWVWMGDPQKADPNMIPDFHWNDDQNWVSVGDYFYVKGSWRLFVDNLLDLSHVAFVHRSTLGTDGVTNFPVKVTQGDETVHVDRWIFNEPAPPMFQKVRDFKNQVDRWQMITYRPPSHFVIDVGCADAGTGAMDGDRSNGVTMFSNHSVTPETEKSSHYFWHHARDFRLDDRGLTQTLAQATKTAFYEDVEIIEAQQERINTARIDKPIIDINADAGVLRARRMLEGLLDSQKIN